MAKTFNWRATDKVVLIDDRFEPDKKYSYYMNTAKVAEKDNPEAVQWAPTLVVPISERRTKDEAIELAKQLCKMLTAAWVKEQLGG